MPSRGSFGGLTLPLCGCIVDAEMPAGALAMFPELVEGVARGKRTQPAFLLGMLTRNHTTFQHLHT